MILAFSLPSLAILVSSVSCQPPSIFVDDRDPRVVYQGVWLSRNSRVQEYNNTVTFTHSVGSIASFQFTGTQVSVFGTREPVGDQLFPSTYSIDNGRSPRRMITNFGDWYWLDYFLVTDPSSPPERSSSPPLSQPTSQPQSSTSFESPPVSTASSQSGSLPPPSTTTIPLPNPAMESSHSPPKPNDFGAKAGMIVGIVIGAVALVGFLLLSYLMWRRHHNRAPLPTVSGPKIAEEHSYPPHPTYGGIVERKSFEILGASSEMSSDHSCANSPMGFPSQDFSRNDPTTPFPLASSPHQSLAHSYDSTSLIRPLPDVASDVAFHVSGSLDDVSLNPRPCWTTSPTTPPSAFSTDIRESLSRSRGAITPRAHSRDFTGNRGHRPEGPRERGKSLPPRPR